MAENLEERDPKFEALIERLQRRRGLDFSGYKRSSLRRRIDYRLQRIGVTSYERYMDFLDAHPGEYEDLLNTILVNVTAFFRDPEAWNYIGETIIPAILEAKAKKSKKGSNGNGIIRVWSAGCASGEEPYSAAMLLAEALGMDKCVDRVKIYATDWDEQALEQARAATYSTDKLGDMPEELVNKYFRQADGQCTLITPLRQLVIFGRHNLVEDAPISNIDLLLCRNVLIYLDSETQEATLPRLHFALNPHGYLVTGRAETMIGRSPLFKVVDMKARAFSKEPRKFMGDVVVGAKRQAGKASPSTDDEEFKGLLDSLLSSGSGGTVFVDAAGVLRYANKAARRMFTLAGSDIGRNFFELEMSFRPVALRPLVDQARASGRSTLVEPQEWVTPEGDTAYFAYEIVPLFEHGAGYLGTAIHFRDETKLKEYMAKYEESREQLESTMQELTSSVEELETTNEELQSTNEELETTNEELQSSNMELEATNEELESTNEELEATNQELETRTKELAESSQYLEAILSGFDSSIIVLDSDFRVVCWNAASRDMWGYRPDEVLGHRLTSLEIGFPTDDLVSTIRSVQQGRTNKTTDRVQTLTRRGKKAACDRTVLPWFLRGEPHGAIILFAPVAEDASDTTSSA